MVDKSVIFLDRIAKIIVNLEEDEISWGPILETFGFEHLLEMNGRLLSSQHFGDVDYSECIRNIFKDAYNENPIEARLMINHILQNDLVHKNDIDILEDVLDNYPGLKDFLNDGIMSSGNNGINSAKKSIKLFISYSTEDKLIAAKIKGILMSFGIKCFMAHDDIEISEEWKLRILNELNEADIFIPLLSDNFKSSDWCSQESGIACYRNILFIPLTINKKIQPYGFMNFRQGGFISSNSIPLEYLINPILVNFPGVNIFENLIEELSEVVGYRRAERLMGNLEPFFDKLRVFEVNILVDIFIKNNQIWDANRCKRHYLPRFIKINKDKIEEDKLKELSKLIE